MSAKRKKLLFVIENSCYGGGEKVFSLLIRGLPRERYALYCASRPEGRFYDEVKDHCRFLPLDLSCRWDLRNVGRLKKLMRDYGVEVAHSQGVRADFYCALAAERAGVCAVSTVAMPVEGFEIGWLRRKAYLALNAVAERRTDHFVTLNGFLRDLLVNSHGVPASRVTVIPNPAVLGGGPDFDATRLIEELGLRGRTVLACLGRLERQKGFDLLMDALGLLAVSRPDLAERVKCVIAGTGSQEARLRRQAAGLGDRVVFAGFRDDVRDFLAAADMFVLPSRAEGQPLALLEAMAAGKPVLAADLPGVREIVADGENGALFRTGDAASLCARLEGMLADPAGTFRLGAAGSAAAARYTLEAYVGAHESLYEGLKGKK